MLTWKSSILWGTYTLNLHAFAHLSFSLSNNISHSPLASSLARPATAAATAATAFPVAAIWCCGDICAGVCIAEDDADDDKDIACWSFSCCRDVNCCCPKLLAAWAVSCSGFGAVGVQAAKSILKRSWIPPVFSCCCCCNCNDSVGYTPLTPPLR